MTDCELSCNEGSVSQECRVTGSSCLALKNAVATLNRLDDFECEKIGNGFFSEVFKVCHKTTKQVMVLKMNLLRSNRPNMRKEVQLMNQLSHPNILRFMGVCVHEGQLHALTEYINGGRLEQIIQDRSIALSYSVRMKLALDIAKGMEYLHSKGVFHRDLTSKNILVRTNEETGEMTAVVGDFGFAAKIPRCGYRLATVGSAYWMSPECLKGEFYDELSDVFSYGIVLCELIGRCEADPDVLPRTESFGLDYIAFTRLCVADPPPPAFLRLAFTCCSYDPSKRPSFTEIVTTLESIIWNSKNPSSKDNNCHAMLSQLKPTSDERIRALGEAMAEQDVHYKPSQQNPFTNIALKTGKKMPVDSSSDADDTCGRVVAEPVVKPSRLRSGTSTGPWLEGGLLLTTRRPVQAYGLLDAILAGSCYHSPRQKGRGVDGGMPPSLPSSPTFARRAAATAHKPQSAPPTAGYRLRACSSGSNLASLEDHVTVLRRRGSCESGFFSSVGDDFCIPGQELVASSVTLSSSSAASSLLLDSAAGEEKIGGGYGRWRGNRASSVYTGSSEDISFHSEQTEEKLRPQQIHKMVEYFERKGSSTEPREYLRQLRSTCQARRGGRGVSARLLVCEGAVSSKLQIFDKK